MLKYRMKNVYEWNEFWILNGIIQFIGFLDLQEQHDKNQDKILCLIYIEN